MSWRLHDIACTAACNLLCRSDEGIEVSYVWRWPRWWSRAQRQGNAAAGDVCFYATLGPLFLPESDFVRVLNWADMFFGPLVPYPVCEQPWM